MLCHNRSIITDLEHWMVVHGVGEVEQDNNILPHGPGDSYWSIRLLNNSMTTEIEKLEF